MDYPRTAMILTKSARLCLCCRSVFMIIEHALSSSRIVTNWDEGIYVHVLYTREPKTATGTT